MNPDSGCLQKFLFRQSAFNNDFKCHSLYACWIHREAEQASRLPEREHETNGGPPKEPCCGAMLSSRLLRWTLVELVKKESDSGFAPDSQTTILLSSERFITKRRTDKFPDSWCNTSTWVAEKIERTDSSTGSHFRTALAAWESLATIRYPDHRPTLISYQAKVWRK